MKLYPKLRRQLDRAIAVALRKHRNIRDAAESIGMPRSSFHDRARELGITTNWRRHAR